MLGLAQLNLSINDFGSIGRSFTLRSLGASTTFEPGGSGASQSYDFADLGGGTVKTYSFLEPSTTAFASAFTNATLALDQQGLVIYYQVTASQILELGVGGRLAGLSADVVLVYDTPVPLFAIPASLNGGDYNVTSGFYSRNTGAPTGVPGIDSLEIIREFRREGIADGEGSLVVGLTTYPNALRYKTVNYQFNTSRVKFNGAWFTNITPPGGTPPVIYDTVTTYSWWVADSAWPVLEVTFNFEGKITDFTYRGTPNPLSVENSTQGLQFRVFPNPTMPDSKLRLELPAGFYQYQVISLSGQTLSQGVLAGDSIQMPDLSEGVYWIRVVDQINGNVGTQPFLVLSN
jgi:hypothetical protein